MARATVSGARWATVVAEARALRLEASAAMAPATASTRYPAIPPAQARRTPLARTAMKPRSSVGQGRAVAATSVPPQAALAARTRRAVISCALRATPAAAMLAPALAASAATTTARCILCLSKRFAQGRAQASSAGTVTGTTFGVGRGLRAAVTSAWVPEAAAAQTSTATISFVGREAGAPETCAMADETAGDASWGMQGPK